VSRARGVATPWMLVGLSLAAGCSARPQPSAPAGAPLGFAPQSAAFEIPFGGEATEDLRLTGAAARGAVLSVVSGGDPDLRIEPLAGERGLNAGLRIHASGRKAGVRVGTLLVGTGPSASRPVPLLFSLRVRGTLRVTPTNPLIDLSRPGAKATFIDVASAQADFVVTAVEIEAGPFTASFERAAPGGTFRVSVTASTGQMARGARGAVGTLVVRSNDAAEPRKEIPLFAFGNSDPPR
jgi:hypothetical protein